MMDYADYAEVRRRAEKRLTVLTIWPFLAFQVIAYGLTVLFSPDGYMMTVLAGIGAFGLMLISALVYRQRTAANRTVRRRAIDETLEDVVAMGWPLEDPTARELRLTAALLDDDLETRTGFGRVVIWSMAGAWALWILTFITAYSYSSGAQFMASVGGFALWLSALGGLTFFHQQARMAANKRVRSALVRATVWNSSKPKRAVEAPWWNEDYDEDKPKRILLEEEELLRVDDDGELLDGLEQHKRNQLSRGA